MLREPLPQDADPDKIRTLLQALEGEIEVLQCLFHNAVEIRQGGQTEHINYRFILPALLNVRRVIYQGLRERGEQLS